MILSLMQILMLPLLIQFILPPVQRSDLKALPKK